LTPTPHPDAPKNRRRTTRRKITHKNEVDRPRSFRDDC
jgi:hypothetical protein